MRQKNTPNDPERRERILAAAMEVLTETGTGGITARAVAERADVPVGSVSYHFDSVRSMLQEASRRVIELRRTTMGSWRQGLTAENLIRRLAELIHHQATEGRELTVVAYELYVLGLRDPDFRSLSLDAIGLLRDELLEHCSPAHATRLAATADGFQMECLFLDPPPDVEEIARVLAAGDIQEVL